MYVIGVGSLGEKAQWQNALTQSIDLANRQSEEASNLQSVEVRPAHHLAALRPSRREAAAEAASSAK